MKLVIFLTALIHFSVSFAQIADASFFPSMKSINPGIAHLRKMGFVALDVGKRAIDRHQDIQTGGLKDGVQYDLAMDKKTLFRAGKGGGLTLELLADQEVGTMTQGFTISDNTFIERSTEAKSNYVGGIIDLSWFGMMIGKADYNYHYFFESGTPPNFWARDNDWKIDYNVMKVGTAFAIGSFTVGAFYLQQSSDGTVDFTFYDPDTGNKGDTIPYDIDAEMKGYGVGIGYTNKMFHFEVSKEQITSHKLTKASDFPWDVVEPSLASRMSFVAEAKLKWFSIGARYRQISGNFYDLEDVITAKLLYEDLGNTDTRTETTFNFSLGEDKGFTYSAFYSSSEVEGEEKSELFSNGQLYPTTTKSTAYGINISYLY